MNSYRIYIEIGHKHGKVIIIELYELIPLSVNE